MSVEVFFLLDTTTCHCSERNRHYNGIGLARAWLYFFINVYIIMISLATVNLPYNYLVVLTVTKDSDCTSCAVAESCLTLCNTMDSSTPDFPVLHCLFKPMSIESVMPSSVTPFSSCPQSFPVSGSFPVSQYFAPGDQSIRASASVLPMDIQG